MVDDRSVITSRDLPAAARVVAAFSSRSLSPAAAGFVRELVAAAAPASAGRAKALLFAAGRLAGFCERLGLGLEPSVLLAGSTVERFILEGCRDVSPATRRTLRTNLRALARALERYPEPASIPLGRERAKQPYTDTEIAGYLRLAEAQSTVARRMRASALVCLGAGAGVIGSELLHVRGSDIAARQGGVIVTVAGARARSVPVLARYHKPLLEAAAMAGERFLLGGAQPGRHNLTDRLVALLSSDSSLPRLQSGRLRSTWLSQCARQIGLGAFMQAAGITCSQRLGDLVARLPAATETELITLLGGQGP
jgi:integrase